MRNETRKEIIVVLIGQLGIVLWMILTFNYFQIGLLSTPFLIANLIGCFNDFWFDKIK